MIFEGNKKMKLEKAGWKHFVNFTINKKIIHNYYYYYQKKVSSARLGESDIHPMSEDPSPTIPTYRQKEEKGKGQQLKKAPKCTWGTITGPKHCPAALLTQR